MERIAVFIERSGIDHNASVLHFLEFVSDHFAVDLFFRCVALRGSAVLKKKTLRMVEILERPTVRTLWEQGKARAKKILRTAAQGERLTPAAGAISARDAGARFPADGYACMVAFDPHGLLLCRECFPAARPFYYSLELYLQGDRPNPFHTPAVRRRLRKVIARQRELLPGIRGLIIQSRDREALLREDYGLGPAIPSLLVPVTSRGKSNRDKLDVARERYSLAPQTRIALHLGGIHGWYSCIELARAFSSLPGWVLLFQGLANRDYLKRMRAVLESEAIANTIISTDFHERMDDLDPLLMSVDIGVAWYNDISPNYTTIGRSSGKIASYLKFGLPVVINRTPSTEEAISARGCGICVGGFAEIAAAVRRIEQAHERFASRCYAAYDEIYNFENYQQALLRFMARGQR